MTTSITDLQPDHIAAIADWLDMKSLILLHATLSYRMQRLICAPQVVKSLKISKNTYNRALGFECIYFLRSLSPPLKKIVLAKDLYVCDALVPLIEYLAPEEVSFGCPLIRLAHHDCYDGPKCRLEGDFKRIQFSSAPRATSLEKANYEVDFDWIHQHVPIDRVLQSHNNMLTDPIPRLLSMFPKLRSLCLRDVSPATLIALARVHEDHIVVRRGLDLKKVAYHYRTHQHEIPHCSTCSSLFGSGYGHHKWDSFEVSANSHRWEFKLFTQQLPRTLDTLKIVNAVLPPISAFAHLPPSVLSLTLSNGVGGGGLNMIQSLPLAELPQHLTSLKLDARVDAWQFDQPSSSNQDKNTTTTSGWGPNLLSLDLRLPRFRPNNPFSLPPNLTSCRLRLDLDERAVVPGALIFGLHRWLVPTLPSSLTSLRLPNCRLRMSTCRNAFPNQDDDQPDTLPFVPLPQTLVELQASDAARHPAIPSLPALQTLYHDAALDQPPLHLPASVTSFSIREIALSALATALSNVKFNLRVDSVRLDAAGFLALFALPNATSDTTIDIPLVFPRDICPWIERLGNGKLVSRRSRLSITALDHPDTPLMPLPPNITELSVNAAEKDATTQLGSEWLEPTFFFVPHLVTLIYQGDPNSYTLPAFPLNASTTTMVSLRTLRLRSVRFLKSNLSHLPASLEEFDVQHLVKVEEELVPFHTVPTTKIAEKVTQIGWKHRKFGFGSKLKTLRLLSPLLNCPFHDIVQNGSAKVEVLHLLLSHDTSDEELETLCRKFFQASIEIVTTNSVIITGSLLPVDSTASTLADFQAESIAELHRRSGGRLRFAAPPAFKVGPIARVPASITTLDLTSADTSHIKQVEFTKPSSLTHLTIQTAEASCQWLLSLPPTLKTIIWHSSCKYPDSTILESLSTEVQVFKVNFNLCLPPPPWKHPLRELSFSGSNISDTRMQRFLSQVPSAVVTCSLVHLTGRLVPSKVTELDWLSIAAHTLAALPRLKVKVLLRSGPLYLPETLKKLHLLPSQVLPAEGSVPKKRPFRPDSNEASSAGDGAANSNAMELSADSTSAPADSPPPDPFEQAAAAILAGDVLVTGVASMDASYLSPSIIFSPSMRDLEISLPLSVLISQNDREQMCKAEDRGRNNARVELGAPDLASSSITRLVDHARFFVSEIDASQLPASLQALSLPQVASSSRDPLRVTVPDSLTFLDLSAATLRKESAQALPPSLVHLKCSNQEAVDGWRQELVKKRPSGGKSPGK